MNWIKDKILDFAIDRVENIVAGLIDLAIETVKDNRTEEFLMKIKNPLHKKIAILLIDVIRTTLESVDKTPDATE